MFGEKSCEIRVTLLLRSVYEDELPMTIYMRSYLVMAIKHNWVSGGTNTNLNCSCI